jgi:hypothetical protein
LPPAYTRLPGGEIISEERGTITTSPKFIRGSFG